MRLGSKISETVKGKLSLGARILQVGGLRKIFKQLFNVGDGEKLLKAVHCYLSTTAGPIAGLLFISTDKIAFCSDRSIKVSSPSGELIRFHYKVKAHPRHSCFLVLFIIVVSHLLPLSLSQNSKEMVVCR